MTDEIFENNIAEFKKYLDGREAKGRAETAEIPRIDVRQIRKTLEMSQSEFASSFWLTIHSVRNWEQGSREPEDSAKAYLSVIKNNPLAVIEALNAEIESKNQVLEKSKLMNLHEQSEKSTPPGNHIAGDNIIHIEKAQLAAKSKSDGDVADQRSVSSVADYENIYIDNSMYELHLDVDGLRVLIRIPDCDFSELELDGQWIKIKETAMPDFYELLEVSIGDYDQILSCHSDAKNSAKVRS